ncbi:MAG: hypothetical protein IIC21_11555, partial [Chloroflexi bacterium]|nr:hypothetical protein [Chloroflexota bacterium]
MKITSVRAIPVSDPIPEERRHRTDLGTKIKSDSVIIQVETDESLVGLGSLPGKSPRDLRNRRVRVGPGAGRRRPHL